MPELVPNNLWGDVLRIGLALTVYLVLLLLSGCTAGAPEPVEPEPVDEEQITPPGSAVIGFAERPRTADPAVAVTAADVTLVSALYTGLLRPDDKGNPVGALARHWEFQQETSTWVFELAPGLTWSNGEPITAADVRDSWLRLLDPEHPSPHAHHLYPVRGASSRASGQGPADSVMIVAVDDHTLAVTVDQMCWFPSVTSVPALYPTPQGIAPTLAPDIAVSGPFRVSAVTPGESVRLEPNPDYQPGPDLKSVTLTGHSGPGGLIAPLLAYEVDAVIAPAPVPDFHRLAREGLVQIRTEPAVCYLLVNTLNSPLASIRVRQALTLGVDRSYLARHVTRGGEQPATGLIPPGLVWPPGDDQPDTRLLPPYEYARAQSLLADSGIASDLNLNLLINTSARNRAIAGFLNRSYSLLGLPLDIVEVDTNTYFDLREEREFDLLLAGREATYPDPLSLLALMTTDNNHNITGWSHPGFDNALIASHTSSLHDRARWLRHAERILIGDAPIVPLLFYAETWLQHRHVQGLTRQPVGPGVNLEHMRIISVAD